MALQASRPGHLGVDNLTVVRSIARLPDRGTFATPLPLDEDGDLIAIVQHMILAGGLEPVRISKVKGHATEADVEQGREDRFGNAEADTAADLGRRHQSEEVMDVRRALINAKGTVVSHPFPGFRLTMMGAGGREGGGREEGYCSRPGCLG